MTSDVKLTPPCMQLYTLVYFIFTMITIIIILFLQRVSIAIAMLSAVLAIVNPSVRLSVRLSVCLSVTVWLCVETTQARIMGSSL